MQGDQSVYLLKPEKLSMKHQTRFQQLTLWTNNVQKLETQVKALFASIHNQHTPTFCFQLY